MKRPLIFVALVSLISLIEAQLAGTAQKNGIVPDKDTAIAVSTIYLRKVYGKDRVAYEEPFSAELKEGVWYVKGADHQTMSGTMEVRIRRSSGEVTYLFRQK